MMQGNMPPLEAMPFYQPPTVSDFSQMNTAPHNSYEVSNISNNFESLNS
jgi:hypothetical protein